MVDPDPREIRPEQRGYTNERIRRIIAWLQQNGQRIEADRVQITFNCAGKRISTEVRVGGEA